MTGQPQDRDERTGAELLREAARLMRVRANGATPGPWSAGKYHDNHAVMAGVEADCWVASTGVYRPSVGPLGAEQDAEHIASWHPAVALAVADWLDSEAESWDDDDADMAYYHPYLVARAYLAAPVSAGEPTRCEVDNCPREAACLWPQSGRCTFHAVTRIDFDDDPPVSAGEPKEDAHG